MFNFQREEFEKLLFQPKEEKKFHLFPETTEYHPLFQIVVQPILNHLVILSPLFNDVAQVMKLISKYGFALHMMRTLSKDNLDKMMSNNDKVSVDIKDFIADENLYNFCFTYDGENVQKACIFLIIEGSENIKFLEKKLLKGVINHNKEFYPQKSKLLYETSAKEKVELWREFFQKETMVEPANFTKCFNNFNFIIY